MYGLLGGAKDSFSNGWVADGPRPRYKQFPIEELASSAGSGAFLVERHRLKPVTLSLQAGLAQIGKDALCNGWILN